MGSNHRKLSFKDRDQIAVLREVPDTVYKHVLTQFPQSAKLSDDLYFVLTKLLADNEMSRIWPKLEAAAARKHRADKSFSEESIYLRAVFDLSVELYRKRNSTRPAYDGDKDRSDRKLASMNKHALTLQGLLQDYPYSYEFFCQHPELSTLPQLLSSLRYATETFKPEGRKRNAVFVDAPFSRNNHGIEGRQGYFIRQCSEGISKFLGEPLHEVVAGIASILFENSPLHPTAENIRQKTTTLRNQKKKQKSKAGKKLGRSIRFK